MPTVPELVDLLNALQKSRAAGVLQVRSADGRTVIYKSDDEMAAACADLTRQITAASGIPITTVLVSSTKGLDT
jgi:hypothetical protein